jgi:prepilin-type N-terminal cleavage/methylation domain-containing protein
VRHPSGGPRRRRGAAGFSLIETLVALAVVASVLLAGAAAVTNHRRALVRLAAGREATAAVGAALEAVRAGAVPVSPDAGPVALAPPVAGVRARGLRLWVETRETGKAGLWEVEVRALYLAAGAPQRRSVKTLVWRPDARAGA